eukprot:scaffold24261_cov264-Cylindrotheca_fusiformis.AAC.1
MATRSNTDANKAPSKNMTTTKDDEEKVGGYSDAAIRKMCNELLKIDGLEAKELSRDDYKHNITKIVTQWEPKFPTVALYVRWAKTNKRDYNTDSVSLLTTLAEQSGFTPLSFLNNVRSYRLVPS